MMKKNLSLLLALLLLLCTLSGCGSAENAETTEPTETESAADAGSETEAPTETESVAVTLDLDSAADAYPMDAEIMIVNGKALTWDIYYHALRQYIYELTYYYAVSDLSEELMEGYTYADYVRESVNGSLSSIAMLFAKADELGLTLDEDTLAGIDEEFAYYADLYYAGDLDALFADLGSEEFCRFQAEGSAYYSALLNYYYGENGANLPDADVVSYAEDQGYLNAKHILFKTVDDNGDALSDEEIAEKKANAEATLALLQAVSADELEASFDALMQEQSEDTGLLYYPDGYYFQEGEMVDEFYEAAAALEVGEVSDLVTSSYGYHILYRPAMDPDDVVDYDSSYNAYTLRDLAVNGLFENMMYEWFTALTVEYADGIETLDLAALFPAVETTDTDTAEADAAETDDAAETAES